MHDLLSASPLPIPAAKRGKESLTVMQAKNRKEEYAKRISYVLLAVSGLSLVVIAHSLMKKEDWFSKIW